MRKFDFSQQIKTKQSKNHNPQRQKSFPVKNSPAVGQIGNRQELQGKSQLQESKRDFDHIHPPSRFRHGFQPCGKQDRKSTRLNSSHANISYAVFCLKKKNTAVADRLTDV